MATVEIAQDGVVKVGMNSPEIGTGHVTTIAQVVSDVFGISPEMVNVDSSYDSNQGHLTYAGTYSNAFNDVYLGAILKAANRLKDKVLRISASVLNEKEADLYLSDNYVCKSDKGAEKKLATIKEIAKISYGRLLSFPKDEEPGLKVVAAYINRSAKPFVRSDFNVQLTHSNSVHICTVEVNTENWSVKILDYQIVHDAGKVINPGIVDGLAIGSTISGIGGALYEEFVFDEQGTNLTVNFGTYLKPTAMEAPDIKIEMMESLAPNTVLGTKAVGEGGAITSLGAIASAVENALGPFNVKITELPITPEKIWKMVRNSEEYKKLNGGGV